MRRVNANLWEDLHRLGVSTDHSQGRLGKLHSECARGKECIRGCHFNDPSMRNYCPRQATR